MVLSGLDGSKLVFPARAGMILSLGSIPTRNSCIPRESGDDPWDTVVQWLNGVYSPRERG